MRNAKTFWTICLLILFNSGLFAQRIQVLTTTGANACPGSLVNCASANPVRLTVVTNLPGDPLNLPFNPNTLRNPPRRFKAFWIMGDGNFLQFGDTDTDAGSRTPPPYNYAAAGNYQATAYLTGKYTNKNWPKRAAMIINNSASAGSVPTPFTARLRTSDDLIDITSNHAIRKKNLTAFVISYARAKQASGIYFFYNGVIDVRDPARNEHRSDFPILNYTGTDLPLYFNGKVDVGKIRSYETTELRNPGSVDGLTFTSAFSALSNKFRDFVYIPAETALAGDLPADFLEKRFFPILQADSTFIPRDTLMNFMVVLTGTESVKNAPLDSLLQTVSEGLSLGNPINTTDNEIRRTDQKYRSDKLQGPAAGPQYIQAIDVFPLPYLVTFDPNQLTVEDITPSGVAGEYTVKFRLEMCNKGQGNVEYELVSVRYSSDFYDFEPVSPSIINGVHTNQLWEFRANELIVGVMPDAHESECVFIEFTAKTNCKGVRSLWRNNPDQPVESCVVFEGAIDDRPECHFNFPIDSTQFMVNGQGICCRDAPTACPFNWILWLLIFLVVIVLFLIRKIFRRSQP